MDDANENVRLSPVSYIVLGLVEAAGEATPYTLKAMAAEGVGNLWSVQHAQIYSEPERLTRAGLLAEEREETGRRRRTYRLTGAGREALDAWRATPATGLTELRDPGLLQLFFGAEPAPLAAAQLDVHRRKLAEYEALRDGYGETMRPGPRLALEAGIAHQHEWIRFWEGLAD